MFHLWLRGCLTNSAGPLFFLFALVQRRLKACVILYQEPVITANAIFAILYWSPWGEFVFQSGPVHSAVERGVLFSKKRLSSTKRVKAHHKDAKREGRPCKDKLSILSWVCCQCFIQRFIISSESYISFSSLSFWPLSSSVALKLARGENYVIPNACHSPLKCELRCPGSLWTDNMHLFMC